MKSKQRSKARKQLNTERTICKIPRAVQKHIHSILFDMAQMGHLYSHTPFSAFQNLQFTYKSQLIKLNLKFEKHLINLLKFEITQNYKAALGFHTLFCGSI